MSKLVIIRQSLIRRKPHKQLYKCTQSANFSRAKSIVWRILPIIKLRSVTKQLQLMAVGLRKMSLQMFSVLSNNDQNNRN